MEELGSVEVKDETKLSFEKASLNQSSETNSVRSLSSQPRKLSVLRSFDVSRRESRSSYLASSSTVNNGGLAFAAAGKVSSGTATEVAQLIERVKKTITLVNYQPSKWTQQHDLAVRQFFTDNEVKRMFAYADKKSLQVTLQVLPTQVSCTDEVQYFIKEGDVEYDPITVDTFKRRVQYGVIQGISLTSLLKLMQKFYVPMFCENQNWPNAVRKDFAGQLDRFMATLTDATHQLQGRTILYLPMDNLDNASQASKNKELVQRLESLLVHWTRQIKEVASNQHSNESAESTGPIEEIAFWQSRCEDLYGLNVQLSQPAVSKITEVLKLAKSTYLEQFMRLSNLIHDGTVQAMDNLKFLTVLREPCVDLSQAELQQIPKIFPKLLHCVRFIWTQSKFYNTRERLTLLLRKISNDVIKRCSSKITLDEVFEGNVGHALCVLQDSITCGEALRAQFAYTSDHIRTVLPSNRWWDFDESSIFAQLDAFMQRCRDLLEIGEAIIQFSRKTPAGTTIAIPVFNGSRGPAIVREMEQMELAFKRMVQHLYEIRERILDVKVTQWHDDYNVFKQGVKDMEVMTQNLIQSAFDQPLTIPEQIQMIDFFHSLAHKESVKRMVERRALDIVKHFVLELNFVKEQFEALRKTPEILRWHPDYAGSAMWVLSLNRRLAQSWQALMDAYWLPFHSSTLAELQLQVEPLFLALQEYVAKSHGEWSANVPRDIAQRLNRPLMKKIHGSTPLLQLNFDANMIHDFEEVHYWSKLKHDIPFHLQDVVARTEELRILKEQVLLVVREYNCIQETLPKEQALIFKERLKFLDKKLSAGLSNLIWANGGTGVADFFLKETRRHCQDVQTLFQEFNDTHKFVERACHEIAKEIPLWNLDPKAIYDVEEFAATRQLYQEQMQQRLSKLSSCIATRLEATRKLFEGDGPDVARQWQLYLIQLDKLLENSLRAALRSSLTNLQHSICGDKKIVSAVNPGSDSTSGSAATPVNGSVQSDLPSLFKVHVVLSTSTNKVEFSPSLAEIDSLVQKAASDMIQIISVVPHLYRTEDDQVSFYDALRSEEEVQKVLLAVSQGASINEGKCFDCLRLWDGYRELWEINKDAFVRRYAKLKPLLSTFDSDINRYNEVANNIQKEETLRSVGFVRLDCSPLKQALVSHCNIWQNKLTSLLTSQADADVARLHKLFETKIAELGHELTNLDDLVSALQLKDELLGSIEDMEAQFGPIHEQYKILEKYEVPLLEEQRQQLESLHPVYLQFQQVLAETSQRLKKAKVDFNQMFVVQLEDWVKAVGTLKSDFNETCNSLTFDVALSSLNQLQERWQTQSTQERYLKKGFALFGMQAPPHAIRDMETIRDEIDWLTSVWTLYGDVQNELNSWISVSFREISHNLLDDAVNRFTKRAVKLGKEAVANNNQVTVFTELKDYLACLKKCVPLLQHLQYQGLRDRHWQQLMNHVGKPFDYAGNALTLAKILDLNLENALDFAEMLANKAARECIVETTLSEMHDEWNNLRFSLSNEDSSVIKSGNLVGDEVLNTLETHQLTVTSLKAKPEYGAFQFQIDDWEQELSKILEVLEQLGCVSDTFACLESVFLGSQDIRKQLPAETVLFESIQLEWQRIVTLMWEKSVDQASNGQMRREPARILTFTRQPSILTALNKLADQLNHVQKSLDKFLDTKRAVFPRFYFLSNSSLTSLLGMSPASLDPTEVQAHLQSMFGCIKALKWTTHGKYHEIKAVESIDGDLLKLVTPVALEGPIELWLSELDRSITNTLKKQLAVSIGSYGKVKKDKWIGDYAPQIVTTALLVAWTNEAAHAIAKGNLSEARSQQHSSIRKWADLIIASLDGQPNSIDEALRLKRLQNVITLQLHMRDVVDKMYRLEVSSLSSIEWTSQMRFYWNKDADMCTISQLNYGFEYGYEYIGAADRLVWTPTTDKCYMNMTLANHLRRASLIEGPAGTGKTETVKELGRLFGKFVRVFNCSDSFSVDALGKSLTGIAQTGAWACFDELNLLPMSVLSVLAAQFSTLFNAAVSDRATVLFEDREICLHKQMALFSTMNPVTGSLLDRSELPDNLKLMLRPISLALPDNVLIIENMLYTRGFSIEHAKTIAKKSCFLFQTASQELSRASHYDWSLRTLVRVFQKVSNASSAGKTTGAPSEASAEDSDSSEELTVYKALYQHVTPSLVHQDVRLFHILMNDIFPGAAPDAERSLESGALAGSKPHSEHLPLEVAVSTEPQSSSSRVAEESAAIIKVIQNSGLQAVDKFVQKSLEFYQALKNSHAVMLVGPTCSGKSAIWNTVKQVNLDGIPVKVKVVNPGVYDSESFFGTFTGTGEWKDGIFTTLLRQATTLGKHKATQWIVLDGPLDCSWAENMNTLLDETRLLILPNGERLFLSDELKIIFERDNVNGLSAATKSRCPCVYVDESVVGYKAVVQSWLNTLAPEVQSNLRPISSKFFDKESAYLTVDCAVQFTKLFAALATVDNGVDAKSQDTDTFEKLLNMWFLFAFIWTFGGHLAPEERRGFDLFMREQEGQFPNKGTVFDYTIDKLNKTWVSWDSTLQSASATIDGSDGPLQESDISLVTTGETACLTFLIKHCALGRIPLNFLGEPGTGKSFILEHMLAQLARNPKYPTIRIPLCSETSTASLQQLVESKLERRTKDVLVPIQLAAQSNVRKDEASGLTEAGSNETLNSVLPLLSFFDNMQAPLLSCSGSDTAPALEWLKHWIDYGHWYDVVGSGFLARYVRDMIPWTCTSVTTSNRVSQRVSSRFLNIYLQPLKDSLWERILATILSARFQDFEESLKVMSASLASSTVSLYQHCAFHFKQTFQVTESYNFHPRDMVRVCASVAERANKDFHDSKELLLKLWIHEATRTLADRLASVEGLKLYYKGLNEVLEKNFQQSLKQLATVEYLQSGGGHQRTDSSSEQVGQGGGGSGQVTASFKISLFASQTWFSSNSEAGSAVKQLYEPTASTDLIADKLHNLIYKSKVFETGVKEHWILFDEFVENVLKLLRIFSGTGVPGKNHVLLMGNGSTGRSSLVKLATWLMNIPMLEPASHMDYSGQDFQDDIASLVEFVSQNPSVPQVVYFINSNLLGTSSSCLLNLHALLSGIPPIWLRTSLDSRALQSVLSKIRIVLLWNPVESDGLSFNRQFRMLPSIADHAQWIRCLDWDQSSQIQIAESFGFSETNTLSVLTAVHQSALQMARKVKCETGRSVNLPGYNFVEFISCYKSILASKDQEFQNLIGKLSSGLEKLEETRTNVDQISTLLAQSRKQVSQFQKQCEDFLIGIVQQKREGDEQAKMVQLKAEKLVGEEEQVKKEADAAQADLEQALPALNAATKALEAINKKDLGEIKSYGKPPPLVEKVLEAVMILRKCEPTWEEAKRQLNNQNFVKLLVELDKDNISDKILKKISQYCADESFQPDVVGRVSGAAKSLCMWVRAMETYGILYRQVAPKRESLATAQEILERKRRSLKEAKEKLIQVTQSLAELQVQYDEKVSLKEKLAKESVEMELRLKRAETLMADLGGERVRWLERVKQLKLSSENLKGDSLLAAASISYLGPFSAEDRQKLIKGEWIPTLENYGIGCSAFSLKDFLGNAQDIRGWILNGLPSDSSSVEAALTATLSRRWPLFIDPQNQASDWIRKMEAGRRMTVLDARGNFFKALLQAARRGDSVLLENVDDDAKIVKEPFLMQLLKYPTEANSRESEKEGSKKQDITVCDDFSLYMTTQNPNPQFSPVIFAQTTVINFVARESGFANQMLSFLLNKEKPELEKQKLDLSMQVAAAKHKLGQLEDDILELLNSAQGSLLDNEKLIQALQYSKQTTEQLTVQLASSEVTERIIDSTREQYRPAAERASMLFFLLQSFSSVNPMYQFPLEAYNELFASSIANSKKSDNIKERLTNLITTHTNAVFETSSRALFLRHRLPFSIQLAVKILQGQNKWQGELYEFFLRGGQVADRDSQLPNPFKSFVPPSIWDNLTELEKFSNFQGILTTIERNENDFKVWLALNEPEEAGFPGEWDDKLSEFERLVFVRALRPDRTPYAASQFVMAILGPQFLKEVSGNTLASATTQSATAPVLLLLKQGVDPLEDLKQLAQSNNVTLYHCALGQNQGSKAVQMIQVAAKNGSWIYLSNLDLALEVIPSIEELAQSERGALKNSGFRIWLGARPSNKLPLSLLRLCNKITMEPAEGIKAHLKRLWNSYAKGLLAKSPGNFAKWAVALLSFHAIVCERKKFASMGWSRIPEFNDDDFLVTANLIMKHLDGIKGISTAALKFLVEEIGYGSRVADEYDKKVFHTYVQQFFTNHSSSSVTGGGPLSLYATAYVSGVASNTPTVSEINDWIQGFSTVDKPELFGQHPNADVAARLLKSQHLLNDLQNLHYVSSLSHVANVAAAETAAKKIAQDVLGSVSDLNLSEADTFNQIKHELASNPLHSVLLAEVKAYNELISTIRRNLNELLNCVNGQSDWTGSLIQLFNAISQGVVPSHWLRYYPSSKGLFAFVENLQVRVKFFQEWSHGTEPILYPIGHFSAPNLLLAAVMQRVARKLNTALDSLTWEFTVTQVEDESHLISPAKDGIYVTQLHLQGASWDRKLNCLKEPANMELSVPMPPIQFRVVENKKRAAKSGYQCPVYYYERRVSATENVSTLILPVELKTGNHEPSFWVKRGAALFATID